MTRVLNFIFLHLITKLLDSFHQLFILAIFFQELFSNTVKFLDLGLELIVLPFDLELGGEVTDLVLELFILVFEVLEVDLMGGDSLLVVPDRSVLLIEGP